jgi:hypothetical protein
MIWRNRIVDSRQAFHVCIKRSMSASSVPCLHNVRLWPIAAIRCFAANVRSSPNSDHKVEHRDGSQLTGSTGVLPDRKPDEIVTMALISGSTSANSSSP